MQIGRNVWIGDAKFGSEPYLIRVGDDVQITDGVQFATHGGSWVFRRQDPSFDYFGRIEIGSNVYIGVNSIILPGVVIGNNVLIAAGSVVTKSCDSGYVYAGNPARKLRRIEDVKKDVEYYNIGTYGLSRDKKRIILENTDSTRLVRK